ncbi:ATP-dependent helicase, partial [Actinomadura geliboluensis]
MTGEAKDVLRDGSALLGAARDLIADHRRAVADVHAALAPLRAEAAKGRLREIPLARLKDVTDGRLRLGPLEEAGFGSVADVLEATPYRLQPSSGWPSARRRS